MDGLIGESFRWMVVHKRIMDGWIDGGMVVGVDRHPLMKGFESEPPARDCRAENLF